MPSPALKAIDLRVVDEMLGNAAWVSCRAGLYLFLMRGRIPQLFVMDTAADYDVGVQLCFTSC